MAVTSEADECCDQNTEIKVHKFNCMNSLNEREELRERRVKISVKYKDKSSVKYKDYEVTAAFIDSRGGAKQDTSGAQEGAEREP